MDRLGELGSQISQLTFYDIKSYYNQAKNMVLNVSEMEAKVREATNEDPWGASSTLMQEIAQGTFNFQQFNEIMPCIYSRFMEKEARQWREIYKALQLLEYIIKHGSERVVDDARSHLSTIKMLRNFHYIDDKGKDQGINVRNRANEISSLLMDLDKVRAERRKAKANRNKYTGTGNDGFGGGGRYGGFGSDSLYEGSSGYGGGSSDYYGGGSSSGFRDDNRRREEYNPDEYDTRTSTARSPTSPSTTRVAGRTSISSAPPKPETKEKEKAVPVDDLLGDWADESAATSSSTNQNKALPSVANILDTSGDDDFDAFQSAPVSPPPTTAAPLFNQAPVAVPVVAPSSKPNVFDMLNQTKPTPASIGAPVFSPVPTTQQAPPATQTVRPNYFGGAQHGTSMATGMASSIGTASQPTRPATLNTHASTKSSSNFDDLWSLGLGSSTGKTTLPGSGAPGGGKSIKDLEREKAQAGIWGASQSQNGTLGGGFGTFGGSSTSGNNAGGGAAAASSGTDDLLL